jgi:biotin operon repressor
MKTCKKGDIYILWGRDQNDILYIGATSNINQRYKMHCTSLKKGREPICKHLRENNFDVNMMVIEDYYDIGIHELHQYENYWIDQFRQWGFQIKNVKHNLCVPPILKDNLIEIDRHPDLASPSFLAEKLNISRTTLWNWAKTRKIKTYEMGSNKFFSLKELQSLIETRNK